MIPGIKSVLAGVILGAGKAVLFKTADVLAAGSTQANAALLTGVVNNVIGADGTKGVILPAPRVPGQSVWVYSEVGNRPLPVYPHPGGRINHGEVNAPAMQAGRVLVQYIATDLTNWAAG